MKVESRMDLADPVRELRWEPTCASVELPDAEAVRSAGLDLELGMARVVLCALSRQICAGNALQRKNTYNTLRLFSVAFSLPYERYGVGEPPAHPELAYPRVPEGGTAMKAVAA